MLTYCYTLTPDTNGTNLVEFPDLPEAAAVSETPDDVQANAAAGLEAALQMYVDARRPIPLPSAVADGSVTLGALATAKALLSNEMVAQGVRKADMARRLGVHMPQVDRLLDVSHASKIEAVEAAFQQLGRRLDVSVV
ncbi:type II toxin-antitoxin system HicB family antitoxin [Bordetella bronchiseptica]|uniref:type II toxin-antitoxin system HicB family antitoxin n=1 Tax=Bordetella bronchiseptica TaxID=518 RepID=UPI000460AA9F|nr:transcriptional regulator [Bordetella bronchiseptica]KAB1444943.1 type II toxin-antitoxin system HicB family antitoxin [Bordetella bronchiseptica]KAB1571163.1 type II toxin-antitoxin system HicB family antitoxin [Bordetella bronchiseptica]KDD10120.1 toxin-antitoxin system, antitoxin component, HicB family [Bordetella bronchiseptica MBORD707]KDD16518.1 toxin-antitoxin system, antitoxin component, HicB family [Bordetella bronchiseptica MBORD731]